MLPLFLSLSLAFIDFQRMEVCQRGKLRQHFSLFYWSMYIQNGLEYFQKSGAMPDGSSDIGWRMIFQSICYTSPRKRALSYFFMISKFKKLRLLNKMLNPCCWTSSASKSLSCLTFAFKSWESFLLKTTKKATFDLGLFFCILSKVSTTSLLSYCGVVFETLFVGACAIITSLSILLLCWTSSFSFFPGLNVFMTEWWSFGMLFVTNSLNCRSPKIEIFIVLE